MRGLFRASQSELSTAGATLEQPLTITVPGSAPTIGRRIMHGVGAVLFVVFTLWINYQVKFGLSPHAGTVDAIGDLRVGAAAPPFNVTELDGTTLSLASLGSGRIVLVEFWATWCPPCRMVLATLRRMEQSLQEHDVAVLSINQGESADQVRQFIATEGTPFHVVLDPDAAVSRRYNITSLPTMVLVDRRGIVRWIHVGHMPETDELRDLLDRVARE